MEASERRRLIKDFVTYCQKSSCEQSDSDLAEYWAVAFLDEVVYEDPELAWTLVLDFVSLNLDDHAAGCLAAGPLEDLIEYHGKQFIARIEDEAGRDPIFKRLLGEVGECGEPDVWSRVVKARERS